MSYVSRIALFLLGSGFCALVYQIAWLRLLRLIFGGSTPASATVIAIFMAGLGTGGYLLGKKADRSPNPLGFYANLEVGISIAAALSPVLIALIRTLYTGLGGTAALGSFWGTLARLILATAVLGVPTFLMGGTLPATIRAATSRQDLGRHTAGWLYAINTIGAVVGALVTTFYLIELLGIRQTIWIAAALNLLIALLARSLARERGALEPLSAADDSSDSEEGGSGFLDRLVLIAAAGVGFVFFLLELVWYRMMAPILGGSTYTFGIVLAVALAGIGLGALIYGLAAQGRRPSPLEFAFTCGLEALAVALPLAAGDRIAFLALGLRDLSTAGFGALAIGWVAVTCCVVLPAAVIAGYQFPLLIALLGSGRRQLAAQVGRTYAWNTFGAIAGSIAGGFVLIPLLSAPTVWRLSIWSLAALSALFLVYSVRTRPRGVAVAAALTLLALGLSASPGPSAFWRHAGIGAGRMREPMKTPNEFADVRRAHQRGLAWEVDGRESSVAVIQSAGYSFVVNGKTDGSARADAPTQVLSGLVASALHPAPRTGLVIGLGTGSSAGWMARVPSIERVDAVELEPAILRVAEDCSPVNEDVLENPKVRVVIADAREYLLTAKGKYDVIFSEPSNPYRAGISSLFTQEFYRAVTERLNEGGLFAQWLQAYEVDAQVVRTAYATLASVFPYVETWQVHASDLVLIGSLRPIDHGAAYIAAAIETEPYDRALRRVWGVEGLEGFYTGYVANPDFARAVAELELAELNTDDRPAIEFGFARSVGRSIGFNVEVLRQLASARDQHRPPALAESLDWDLISELRESRTVMLNRRSPSSSSTDPGHRQRTDARKRYVEGDLGGAWTAWQHQDQAPLQPIDLVAVAESAAEVASELLPELTARLLQSHPVEAGLIEARWHLRRGEHELAASRLRQALVAYRTDPWPFEKLTERGVWLARDIAAASPASAAELLDGLSRPFSLHLHDQLRLMTQAGIAFRFGDLASCVEPLLELEPIPPWREGLLKVRASCYARARHPLAALAARDLEDFYAAAEVPFWRGLVPQQAPDNLDLESSGGPDQSLSPTDAL